MRIPGNTYFTTMSIHNWQPIFRDFPETNTIVLDSLNYLVESGKVRIFAFVIMKDHIHLLWQLLDKDNYYVDEQAVDMLLLSFRSFTGGRFKRYLDIVDEECLDLFGVARQDRHHKFWKTGRSTLLIQGDSMLMTKIRYIHNNPTKEGAYKSVENCEDYYFSSARAYANQKTNFPFLTLLDLSGRWY